MLVYSLPMESTIRLPLEMSDTFTTKSGIFHDAIHTDCLAQMAALTVVFLRLSDVDLF